MNEKRRIKHNKTLEERLADEAPRSKLKVDKLPFRNERGRRRWLSRVVGSPPRALQSTVLLLVVLDRLK